MIYLDVTSACQSSLNTGVKRVQRGLHATLRGRPDYQPVRWQSARRRYRALNTCDHATLEQNLTPRGLGLVDSFAPGVLSDWLHYLRDAGGFLDWPARSQPGDVLLVPDLVWDNRGRFLTQLRGAPLRRIAVFHDAIALRRPRQSRIDRYFCARGIRALAAFDGVLCISREAEKDLHHYWHEWRLPAVPTQVVPWPVPFPGPRPACSANFSAKRILYVARLEPHKNHLRLLAACEELWLEGFDFDLQLIGCIAYPDTAWHILRRVHALRKAGRALHWQAHVGEAELHAAYRDCSFTAFPSLMEGFGLPIVESLWHGRPVVCGANGALGEVTKGGGCETVETENVTSLAAGLRRLLTDEARYETLFREARQRIFRTWSDYEAEITPFLQTASGLSK
jgi:glycosyltransferase involved in cell wall biosynthesis